jgi:hypothetical protein
MGKVLDMRWTGRVEVWEDSSEHRLQNWQTAVVQQRRAAANWWRQLSLQMSPGTFLCEDNGLTGSWRTFIVALNEFESMLVAQFEPQCSCNSVMRD